MGRFKILIAETISPEMQESVIDEMIALGFSKEAELLEEPFNYTAFVFLHDLAHAKNLTWLEKECAKWALEQLKSGNTFNETVT
jgi:hypothetical protein